jgi:hypothetical protein
LVNDRYLASPGHRSPGGLNGNNLSGAQGIGVSRIAFDDHRGCRVVSNFQSVNADAAKTGDHSENAGSAETTLGRKRISSRNSGSAYTPFR